MFLHSQEWPKIYFSSKRVNVSKNHWPPCLGDSDDDDDMWGLITSSRQIFIKNVRLGRKERIWFEQSQDQGMHLRHKRIGQSSYRFLYEILLVAEINKDSEITHCDKVGYLNSWLVSSCAEQSLGCIQDKKCIKRSPRSGANISKRRN